MSAHQYLSAYQYRKFAKESLDRAAYAERPEDRDAWLLIAEDWLRLALVMCEAFDAACRDLHDTGQPDLVYEVIAKRIIEAAKSGERDPEKLRDWALAFGRKQG